MLKSLQIELDGIPAVIYGEDSDSVYLFVHGKSGYKEEGEDFANQVCEKGWQVLAIDLPEHGKRADEDDARFVPWDVLPELRLVMKYIHTKWKHVGLRANSIGAWFSMLSFPDEQFENCLFVSPILDMNLLIRNMMNWAGVTEEQLKKRGEIPTEFGETLSYRYLIYSREHKIEKWDNHTAILYAGKDNLTNRDTVNHFAEHFHCHLSVMEQGEHWFHTEEQMKVLHQWVKEESTFA